MHLMFMYMVFVPLASNLQKPPTCLNFFFFFLSCPLGTQSWCTPLILTWIRTHYMYVESVCSFQITYSYSFTSLYVWIYACLSASLCYRHHGMQSVMSGGTMLWTVHQRSVSLSGWMLKTHSSSSIPAGRPANPRQGTVAFYLRSTALKTVCRNHYK